MRDDSEEISPLPVNARVPGPLAHLACFASLPVRVRPGPRDTPVRHSPYFPFRTGRPNKLDYYVQSTKY